MSSDSGQRVDAFRRLLDQAVARGWITAERASALVSLASADTSAGSASAIPVGDDATLVSDGPPPHLAPLSRLLGPAPGLPAEERYAVEIEIGRGGAGRVMRALDRVVGRRVALKQLRPTPRTDPTLAERFLDEARITGQLEHPAVVPVYDLGLQPDGQPFYTMREVGKHSMRDVLVQPPPRPGWPLSRLCTAFAQVCRALAYAHARGVIHRDVKPHNILLGDYGEVYLADWGIAALMSGAGVDTLGEPAGPPPPPGADAGIIGTAGYMPPEQALGRWEQVDHRADLFALGAVLYEILTGRRAFPGKNHIQVLTNTLDRDPVRPREIVPDCPLVLEELCLRLLNKDPAGRPASASAVAEEVEAYLEGAREKERRRAEAARLLEQARAPAERHAGLGREVEACAAGARRLLRDVKPWEPVELKREGWALETQARALAIERARAFAEAVDLHAQALNLDPASAEARRALAELYWEKAEGADASRDEPARIYYEARVREMDDGRFTSRLNAPSELEVGSDPPGAEVFLARYVEVDRRLVPAEERRLGVTPVAREALEPGSWLLRLVHPAFREVRYPVRATRGGRAQVQVRLRTDAEIGPGLIFVPAGPCRVGGDPEALDSLPTQETWVDDFAVARHAVTYREYLEFINDLWPRDPDQARARLPRDESGQGACAVLEPSGRWAPNVELIVEGSGRRFCPPDRVPDVPVFSVDWWDAVSYCKWRTERDGVPYRLPGDAELEKAARGADGRFHPWGDRADPTFAKGRDSRPGVAQPEPVGAFPLDESPYGVRDLAGTIRTWIGDVHGERSARSLLEELPSGTAPREETLRVVRGGAWGLTLMGGSSPSRSASRHLRWANTRNGYIGIRLARSFARAPGE